MHRHDLLRDGYVEVCLSSYWFIRIYTKSPRNYYYTLFNVGNFILNLHFSYTLFNFSNSVLHGRDSSVGIATRYWLDGPGIKSQWGGEIFRTRPDRHCGPPSLLYNGYQVFPGGKTVGA